MRHIKLLILSIIFGSVFKFFVSTRPIVLCFISYCLKQQAFCLGVFILSKYKYMSSLSTVSPLCDVRERYEAKLGQDMGCSFRGKKKKRPKCVVWILPRGRFPRIHFMKIFSVTKSSKIAAILENSEKSVRGVRMRKSGPLERAELANQIQGFGIQDRWDASERNKTGYHPAQAREKFGANSVFECFIRGFKLHGK